MLQEQEERELAEQQEREKAEHERLYVMICNTICNVIYACSRVYQNAVLLEVLDIY